MNRLPSILLCLLGLLALAPTGQAQQAKLKVIATIPDIATLVREVGGDRVEVKSICKGTENVHAVRLKPSHLVAASRSDMFFQVGLSLEHAWVPGLLQTVRNRKIQPGSPGHVTVSHGIQPIQVPVSLSREFAADVHPEGNPHFYISHGAGRHIAQRVYLALAKASPQDEPKFKANLEAFVAKSKKAEARWKELGKLLKGRKCVQFHSEFDYLLQDLGVEVLGTLEPKPGVPPTPRHVQKMVKKVREQGTKAGTIPVFATPWMNQRPIHQLIKATPNCTKCLLPSMTPRNGSWLEMMEAAHVTIAKAFDVPYPPKAEKEAVPASVPSTN